MEALLRRRPFTRLGRTPTLSFLAARTQFFDDAVREALEEGAAQVVIVGAGYDSRAWRLARNGVSFFEVDHPATQSDKRSRAPSGGPTYVPADLRDESLIDALQSDGFDSAVRTIFVVEGLTMYLDERTVARLLADLAVLGVAGSRLAVNFTVSGGGSVAPMSRMAAKVIRTVWRVRGEPIINWVQPNELPAVLRTAGWRVLEQTPAPELAARYLADSQLPTRGLSPGAIAVSALRDASCP